MLRSTSLNPRSLYSRLKQFTGYYESGLWNIASDDALELIAVFKGAYEMIVEDDERAGINTCEGYCKTYGIRCVVVWREEFYSQFQMAVDVISMLYNTNTNKITRT